MSPSESLLRDVKSGRIIWPNYVELYVRGLSSEEAQSWMEKRASEAKLGNILLVCFERDSFHCHRRLLAEEIAKRFGVEYKGEVQ